MIRTAPTCIASLLATVLVAGCASDSGTLARDTAAGTPTKEACEPEIQTADERLAGAGIAQIYESSQLVVVGMIEGTKSDVAIGPDKSYTYDVHTIKVAELVKGSLESSVDVALMARHGCHPVVIEGRAAPSPGNSALWMLDKIDADSGFVGYRLTAMPGLVTTVDGRIDVPDESLAGRQANDAGTLERLVDQLHG